MSTFVNIATTFGADINFWELNPQLIFMPPFSRLYQMDGGGDHSSRLMWTVYFICDPDEKENKFFKFGRDRVQEMLEETYFNQGIAPDWEDPNYEDALEAYPDMCLSAVQRSFMMKKRALLKRGRFLEAEDYNRQSMKDLDLAHSKTAKIMDEYDKLEERFFAEQAQARVKGGRKQSKAEQHDV
jgi:hypothetical protein